MMLINTAKQTQQSKQKWVWECDWRGWVGQATRCVRERHFEGLSMGETSDPSSEGQRGNPVRIREGRDVPGNRKRKVPGARKEAQNDWGMVRS